MGFYGIMENKKILIGVTGGIAAYKICSLIGMLKKAGAEAQVIMTEAATKFISPLTFQTLSGNPAHLDMFALIDKAGVKHISLAKWCDVMVIAPATANTIGKIANGIADNFLTTVAMALPKETPVLIAPAMNTNMWRNELVQANVEKLKKQNKYHFVGPVSGKLACGDEGEGVMADPKDIFESIKSLL